MDQAGSVLALRSPYASSSPGRSMNRQIRTIADLDRVIHEPGRLMIVALLFAVDRSDFLYLQHESRWSRSGGASERYHAVRSQASSGGAASKLTGRMSLDLTQEPVTKQLCQPLLRSRLR